MSNITGDVCPWASGGPADSVFGGFITLLLTGFCSILNNKIYPKDRGSTITCGDIPEYDFIIGGAGTSGSIVARRLAENNFKVLLLEAGGDSTVESEIPLLVNGVKASNLNWGYTVEPNCNYCQSYENKQCHVTSGKVLGGTSTIDCMMYARGNKEIYDQWEKDGNCGWGYKSIKKYFDKIEKLLPTAQNYQSAKKDYGANGVMSIDSFGMSVSWRDVLKNGWVEAGQKVLDHTNVEKLIGIADAYGLVNGGQRVSTAKGYLGNLCKDVGDRLHVVRQAQIIKVLIDDCKRAYGVRISLQGKEYDIKATKEVILSSGSVGSSQILMLSGIGPEKHLKKVGIETVVNLPVGIQVYDHPLFIIMMDTTCGQSQSKDSRTLDLANYLSDRKGPFSTVGLEDLEGYLASCGKATIPNLQFTHFYAYKNSEFLLNDFIRSLRIDGEYKKEMIKTNSKQDSLYIMPAVVNPKSSSRIELRSCNPLDKPKIFGDYYATEEDYQSMLEGIKFVEKLECTKAFKNAGLSIRNVKLCDCPYEFKSEKYWRCMINQLSKPSNHHAGGARMGPKNDGNSVVDPRLRVHGIKNLRVIDSSVMPSITRGDTTGPAMLIGEKGADMICEDWRTQCKK